MTLIVGIILPNGILMVSDSRAQIENKEEVQSEYTRKINIITPTNILGSAGFEPTLYTSQILRKTLFLKNEKLTTEEKQAFILKLYEHVNLLHLFKRDFKEPLGHILLGELNSDEGTYTLLSNYGEDGFKNFKIHNKVKDTVVIGAYSQLRDTVKKQIQDILDTISEENLNRKDIHSTIALECHKIFKEHAAYYDGINDKLYCVHLSTIENDPSAVFYFLESDGSVHFIDKTQDGVEISYTE
ncbi:hypothetical protein LAE98_10475 [Bacillus wiedmannii]|uniref:hypothetical protein n=1 Tax=Bacillus wiedmannii TaxID=1890302 RepID=UPI001CBB2DCA|nr:hypothetical protein [Bacillus wiedmannii]MBZ4222524.1 hypothetical protein [Bacillus wiedmannii]